jgi:hypothetical protein
MPSILEQAETIRDATTVGANTAERVGTCLVDIANTIESLSAQIYVVDNEQVTVSDSAGEYVKILADTSENESVNSGFECSANRMTYDGSISHLFHVTATATLYIPEVSAGETYRLAVYVHTGTQTYVDSDSAGEVLVVGEKATQVSVSGLYNLGLNNYVELHLANVDGPANVVVSRLNFMVMAV